MAGRGGMFWTSSPSQIYAEPKRLLALGWITGEKQTGQDALANRLPPYRGRMRGAARVAPCSLAFPKLQHEASTLASLRTLRRDIDELSAVVATNTARAPALTHRTRCLLLQQDLGRRLVEAHADWLDAVERELSSSR